MELRSSVFSNFLYTTCVLSREISIHFLNKIVKLLSTLSQFWYAAMLTKFFNRYNKRRNAIFASSLGTFPCIPKKFILFLHNETHFHVLTLFWFRKKNNDRYVWTWKIVIITMMINVCNVWMNHDKLYFKNITCM